MRRSPPQRLLSLGSIVADIFMAAPHLPPRGGDVIASSAGLAAGGGFNVLAAAARQGMPAAFAGRHGTGPFGACIRAALAGEGISVLRAATPDADSGFCVVIVEPDGERSFITSPGVEADPGPHGLDAITPRAIDAVVCSGYDLSYPALGPAIADWLRDAPDDLLVVVDPGPLARDIPSDIRRRVLARAGLLTMNRREARLLTGADDAADVARRLEPECAPGALMILRDGAAGCDVGHVGRRGIVHIPAPVVDAVDTTGAGDTHTGVLIAALAQGCDQHEAVRRANVAAAMSVTRRGPASAPRASELREMLTGVAMS